MQLDSFFLKNPMIKKNVLANFIKISPAQLNHFIKKHRPVPVKYCRKIVQFTNGEVTLQDLRPNDWQDIWGEE